MRLLLEPSLVGTAIQTAGVTLLAVLSFVLTRSVERQSLRYWTMAWSCLSIALAALLLSFTLGLPRVLQPVYVFGEYAFGILFVTGCRVHAGRGALGRRDLYLLFAPAAALALILPPASGYDINRFFVPHAGVVAILFFVALHMLSPLRRDPAQGAGLTVMRVALALLAFTFAHYVPVFAYVDGDTARLPFNYLQYTSLYDLIFEILLGFGTVMLVTHGVRQELEQAHRDVSIARDRLEVIARMDPLTESLNRHAFYSLVESNRTSPAAAISGSAVVVDVDGLKQINDTHGHRAGDIAIRRVAKAIRTLIRPDDLLFRWGGDEFLILLFGVQEPEARRRLMRLNQHLSGVQIPGIPQSLAISVSYGVSSFDGVTPLDDVIADADSDMYARKSMTRSLRA
jgi:diguanylate cyclase (GGDEF)-like protein